MPGFARFTAEAREAMVLAQEEAARLRHPWLGTEHLLLGLLRGTNTAANQALTSLGVTAPSVEQVLLDELGPPLNDQVLGREDEEALRILGIDLQEVRRRIEATFGPGALDRARPRRCGFPIMPRLKRSLEQAAGAAGKGSIDTDHLLVGMMGVRGALAVLLLERLAVSTDLVVSAVETQRRRAS